MWSSPPCEAYGVLPLTKMALDVEGIADSGVARERFLRGADFFEACIGADGAV